MLGIHRIKIIRFNIFITVGITFYICFSIYFLFMYSYFPFDGTHSSFVAFALPETILPISNVHIYFLGLFGSFHSRIQLIGFLNSSMSFRKTNSYLFPISIHQHPILIFLSIVLMFLSSFIYIFHFLLFSTKCSYYPLTSISSFSSILLFPIFLLCLVHPHFMFFCFHPLFSFVLHLFPSPSLPSTYKPYLPGSNYPTHVLAAIELPFPHPFLSKYSNNNSISRPTLPRLHICTCIYAHIYTISRI